MAESVGLDVSMKETAVSIRRDGKRIWRGKCASDPKLVAEVIRRRAPDAARVVFETGPLSVWFFHTLTAEGLPAICIDARHAKAALDMAPNKTDAHDADGLAQLAEVGFFGEVRVRSEAHRRGDPPSRTWGRSGGVRDRALVSVVLSCADSGRAAGDLHRCAPCQGHRCAPCQGSPGHGPQQNRCP